MAAQSLLNGKFSNPMNWFMDILLMLPAILIGLSFHEYAHAKVSSMLGDDVPIHQGRVTINPAAHIDPIGLVALLFIGFGWGKPVEINPRNYKHPRRDEFLVAIAGVTMNLLIAILFTGILKAISLYMPSLLVGYMGSVIIQIIFNIIQINIVLMVFNLIPIPPLDGFNIVTQIFNLRGTELYYKIYNYGFVILVLLMILDVTDVVLGSAVSYIFNLLGTIFSL